MHLSYLSLKRQHSLGKMDFLKGINPQRQRVTKQEQHSFRKCRANRQE